MFVLGGLKISDAFSMRRKVLGSEIADVVLTSGITGQEMLLAAGLDLGKPSETLIRDRSLDVFLAPAAEYLESYSDKIRVPVDVAFDQGGTRAEMHVSELPAPAPIIDIATATATVESYRRVIDSAATIFVNGPAGVYESEVGSAGTRELWSAIAEADAYSVMGGGDTVASARRFIDLDDIGFVSSAGGALIRYLSGQPLPKLVAMEEAKDRT